MYTTTYNKMLFCFNKDLNCSEEGSLPCIPSQSTFLSFRKFDILFSVFDSVLSGFKI